MSIDPNEKNQHEDDESGTVSEAAADPTPPATEATTAEDVSDTPQIATRQDVAEHEQD